MVGRSKKCAVSLSLLVFVTASGLLFRHGLPHNTYNVTTGKFAALRDGRATPGAHPGVFNYQEHRDVLAAHRQWQAAALQHLQVRRTNETAGLPDVVLINDLIGGWGNRLPTIATGEIGQQPPKTLGVD